MSKVKSKIIVIMGPTASGKSDVAIKLAQKFNGEIISADSRQIYRGLNIGSGKVPGAWSVEHGAWISEKIPHYLIDVAQPMEDFNISHFKTLANEAIEKILAKGKIPIICGGTGFWIDAVVSDINLPEVPPNFELRKKLEKQSLEELFEELQKLDPERASSVDKKNKYRLVRALEIIEKLGSVPSLQDTKKQAENPKYEFLQIGILTERETLNEKIKKRLESRFGEPTSTRRNDHSSTRGGGMIKEVEDLHAKGVSFEWMEKIGLEYRWISRFLQEKFSPEEMKEKLYFDIIHYAKRQMTWFRKNKEIIWLKNYEDIEKETKNFLKKI
jgi:tRNA dimethylallyltransferase